MQISKQELHEAFKQPPVVAAIVGALAFWLVVATIASLSSVAQETVSKPVSVAVGTYMPVSAASPAMDIRPTP